MRKWLIAMTLLVTVTLLAGCSLSFVEELLSSNNDDNNVMGENTNHLEDNQVNEDNMDEGNHNLNEANINNNDGDGNNEDEATGMSHQQGACEGGGHDQVLDRIDATFILPDCAILTEINSGDAGFNAYLEIENGDWEEVGNEYIDAFADQLTNESLNIKDERITLAISFGENHKIEVDVKQRDQITYLSLYYKDERE